MAQIPNISHPIADNRGTVTTPWYQFLSTFGAEAGGTAPGIAGYVVTGANGALPNARVATDSDTITIDLTVPGVIRWHATSAGGWVPLSLGVEPLEFVSDGAGTPIFVGYTP